MNRQYRNPSVPARIAAWVTALAMTFAITLTLIGWTCVNILISEDLHVQTATNEYIVSGQMDRVSNTIRELSEKYGFSADNVISALNREEFISADREMAKWWSHITTEGVMSTEVPAWSANSLLPVIEESLVPEMMPEDQSSTEVAQEIGLALEKEAKRTMMPVRRTLITLGFRYLDKRIDIPGAVRLINKAPEAGAVICILLAGMIALLTGKNIRTSLKYYGGALAGAGISAAFALILIRHFGIMDMVRGSSKGLSDQISIMMRLAGTKYIMGIAILLAAGIICLLIYIRTKMDRTANGGTNETGKGHSPDPV